jgi:hypothetical protein
MSPGADALKYATDTRKFKDAVVTDRILDAFEDSPMSVHCKMNDICIYAEGDKNKIGTPKVKAGDVDIDKHGNPILDEDGNPVVRKKDSTSWDSFSYALQMGHNVWMHIESTQRANREYDAGISPYMLINDTDFPGWGVVKFKEVVNEIFSLKDRQKSLDLIEKYDRYWMHVIGTRLNIGKKAKNALTKYGELFE